MRNLKILTIAIAFGVAIGLSFVCPSALNSSTSSFQFRSISISGVVTYFSATHQEFRPDIGARVYICPVTKSLHDTSFAYEAPHMFLRYELEKIKCDTRSLMGNVTDANRARLLNVDSIAAFMVDSLEQSPKTIRTVVDGNGRYSKQVKTGIYVVLIVSRHLSDQSRTETDGLVKVENLFAAASQEYEINAEFQR